MVCHCSLQHLSAEHQALILLCLLLLSYQRNRLNCRVLCRLLFFYNRVDRCRCLCDQLRLHIHTRSILLWLSLVDAVDCFWLLCYLLDLLLEINAS